jgi:hypothetical protein
MQNLPQLRQVFCIYGIYIAIDRVRPQEALEMSIDALLNYFYTIPWGQ